MTIETTTTTERNTEAHQSAGFVGYLPLDMLNPHTCSDASLREISAEPECPSQVQAYIAGVLAGRMQARSANEQSTKTTELLERLTWSIDWELGNALHEMRLATLRVGLQSLREGSVLSDLAYEDRRIYYTKLRTVSRIAHDLPALALAGQAAQNEADFLLDCHRD